MDDPLYTMLKIKHKFQRGKGWGIKNITGKVLYNATYCRIKTCELQKIGAVEGTN